MWKAKPFGVGQCYYLIANLDGDDYSSEYPLKCIKIKQ